MFGFIVGLDRTIPGISAVIRVGVNTKPEVEILANWGIGRSISYLSSLSELAIQSNRYLHLHLHTSFAKSYEDIQKIPVRSAKIKMNKCV